MNVYLSFHCITGKGVRLPVLGVRCTVRYSNSHDYCAAHEQAANTPRVRVYTAGALLHLHDLHRHL